MVEGEERRGEERRILAMGRGRRKESASGHLSHPGTIGPGR